MALLVHGNTTAASSGWFTLENDHSQAPKHVFHVDKVSIQ